MSLKKHAYLIMAHEDFSILEKLIEAIDDKRNDIYIHIDKKVKTDEKNIFNALKYKSKIYFIDRMKVNWGGFSQIECELTLLKAAVQNSYSYYHLLSGADFPLKDQNEIHEFFEINSGKEFVHFDGENLEENYLFRLKYYHFFQENNFFAKNRFSGKLRQLTNKYSIYAQKIIGVDRLRSKSVKYMKGANWFSITDEFARYVISKEDWIMHTFKNTLCCDEVFLQTILYNSRFKNNLYLNDFNNNYLSIMRCIDWERGNPYTWKVEDTDTLINSPFLFARKFSSKTDGEIIRVLRKTVLIEKT